MINSHKTFYGHSSCGHVVQRSLFKWSDVKLFNLDCHQTTAATNHILTDFIHIYVLSASKCLRPAVTHNSIFPENEKMVFENVGQIVWTMKNRCSIFIEPYSKFYFTSLKELFKQLYHQLTNKINDNCEKHVTIFA